MDRRLWAILLLAAAFTLSIGAQEELAGENVCTTRKNVTEKKLVRDPDNPGKYKFEPVQVEKDVRECCEGYQPTKNGTACEPAVLLADRSNWFIWFVIAGILALAAISLLAVFGYKHKAAAEKAKKEHSVKYTADESDDEDVEANNRVFRPDYVPQTVAPLHPRSEADDCAEDEYVELGANQAASSNDYESIPANSRQSVPASFENPNRSSTQPLLASKKIDEEEDE
ncbi:hypothetical protein M3Y99_00790500 [Aphelenchoides fujianensis]|nr:hypothetical protein M3Y99_00790500 [Aphelenchoides fujianensis]